MAEKPDTAGDVATPPWLPFKTMLNFIEWLGEVGVPQRIGRDFWSRKLAGNIGPLVINALQFFALIDENAHATAALDEIAQDPEKRKEFFSRKFRDLYGNILKTVNLERATRTQLAEEFSKVFGVRGSVQTKSVIFFVHLARYVGANVSNHIIIRERKSGTPRKKKTIEPSSNADVVQPLGTTSTVQQNPTVDHADAQESLLLWGLFKRLPKPRTPWPAEDRKRWLETLQNVISLEYAD
jgi:hypothetical protein